MPEIRYVKCVKKAYYGDIIASGNHLNWGIVTKDEAITQIVTRTHEYKVQWQDNISDIKVIINGYNQYLRTDKDGSARNNLE